MFKHGIWWAMWIPANFNRLNMFWANISQDTEKPQISNIVVSLVYGEFKSSLVLIIKKWFKQQIKQRLVN